MPLQDPDPAPSQEAAEEHREHTAGMTSSVSLPVARPMLPVIALVAMLIALGLPPSVAVPPDLDDTGDGSQELQQEIDVLLEEHVGVTTPGAMVTVVGPKGALLTETGGWADPLSRTPLTPASRTPVASVSKVVTSLTALRLHDEGLLDLDADVRDQVAVTDRRDPAVAGPVTGRHLLTHHSGLSEPLLVHPALPDPPPTDLQGLLEQNPPVLTHPADAGLHYSPLQAHTMLGAMIEEATNTSFEQATTDWVLEPVGADTAGFEGATATGDVALMAKDGEQWVASPWPAVPETPAAMLTWSLQDASALLTALVAENSPLPDPVVEQATTVAVRPAHGGGGHTQVFFENWRSGVPVLEHAGANGLAWLALIPEAEIGVFVAVTTEDPQAAEFTTAVLDTLADWTARSRRAEREPMPRDGMATITPPWAEPLAPADPVGTHQERLFAGRGPELLLRTVTGQITVTRDGDDVLLGERRLTPSQTPGRWCDRQGCLAAVTTEDGGVTVLRSNRAMLQQTMTPAPWWADQRFVLVAVLGTLLTAVVVLCGAVRAWWHRRRGVEPPPAVSSVFAAAWVLASLALVGATVLLPLSVLTAPTVGWIRAEGPAIWGLRVLTLIQLLLGAAWTLRAVSRWQRLGPWQRALVPPALALGAAMSVVLVSWALPLL